MVTVLEPPRVADLPDVDSDEGDRDHPDDDVDPQRDDGHGEGGPPHHGPHRHPLDPQRERRRAERRQRHGEVEPDRPDEVAHHHRAGEHEGRLGEADHPRRLVDDHKAEGE